jgi:hypothetical protein
MEIFADVACMFYTEPMPSPAKSPTRATLTLKLGGWLEAHATGWGVAAIPIVILSVLGASALRWFLA